MQSIWVITKKLRNAFKTLRGDDLRAQNFAGYYVIRASVPATNTPNPIKRRALLCPLYNTV